MYYLFIYLNIVMKLKVLN